MPRAIIRCEGRDVSGEIAFVTPRGNPFGWSQHTMTHEGASIGTVDNGDFRFTDARYSVELVEEAI